MAIRADLHIHSRYSHDSHAGIRPLLKVAKRRGLDAIAITDHDTVEGGKRAREMRRGDDVEVIPGVEITVPMGRYGLHLVALFVERCWPVRDFREALDLVNEQRGILIIPHPLRIGTGLIYHLTEGNITDEDAQDMINRAEYIEGLNYKFSFPGEVAQTVHRLGDARHPFVAGSDAHIPAEVGLTWTEFDTLDTLKAGRSEVRIGGVVRHSCPPDINLVHAFFIGTEPDGIAAARGCGALKKRLRKLIDAFPISIAGQPLRTCYQRLRYETKTARRTKAIDRELSNAGEIYIEALGKKVTLVERNS